MVRGVVGSREDIEAVRRRLRRGILPVELLPGGKDVVLRSGDRHLTGDELKAHGEQVAAGLRELGVEPGDRIAIYSASHLDWVIAYLGAQRAGACVVPINPDYHSAEVEHIAGNAEPSLVIADSERAAVVEKLGLRSVDVHHPPHGAAPPMPALTPDSPAAILYTSGTTGRAKGAVLDHGGLLAQARGAIEMWRWTSGDVLVHALPLIHLSPQGVVAELTRNDADRGTMFFGVPAMYQRLCDWLDEHTADLSRVRLFVSGSAPLPPALFERCERLLGQAPVERYGITEGGIVVTNPYEGPRQPGRVGV